MGYFEFLSSMILLFGYTYGTINIDVFGHRGPFSVTLMDGDTKLINLKEQIAIELDIPISTVVIIVHGIILDNENDDLSKRGITSVTFMKLPNQIKVFNYGGEYRVNNADDDKIEINEYLGLWDFEFYETPEEIKDRILQYYGIKDAWIEFKAVKDDNKYRFASDESIECAIIDIVSIQKFPDGYKFFLVIIPKGEIINLQRIYSFGGL